MTINTILKLVADFKQTHGEDPKGVLLGPTAMIGVMEELERFLPGIMGAGFVGSLGGLPVYPMEHDGISFVLGERAFWHLASSDVPTKVEEKHNDKN